MGWQADGDVLPPYSTLRLLVGTQLDVALPLMFHLRIHPDGRQITFSGRSAQTDKNEVWVMENFLPPPKAAQ